MKKIILSLILVLFTIPAIADELNSASEIWLNPVEPQYVCMVTDRSFKTPQFNVEVEGKTYFGCCPMCKSKLEKDSSLRAAIDPVSGNDVDKATATIGTDLNQNVYYFENEDNFKSYAAKDMPKEPKM